MANNGYKNLYKYQVFRVSNTKILIRIVICIRYVKYLVRGWGKHFPFPCAKYLELFPVLKLFKDANMASSDLNVLKRRQEDA